MANEGAVPSPAPDPEVKSRPDCTDASDPCRECSDRGTAAAAAPGLAEELPGSRKRRPPEQRAAVHPGDCCADAHHDCSEHRAKRVADAKSGLGRGEQRPSDVAAAGKSDAVEAQPDDGDADKREDAGAAAGRGFRPPVIGGSRGRGAFPWTAKALAGLEMDLSSSDDEDKTREFAWNHLLMNQQCGALACMLAAAAVLEDANTDSSLEEEDEEEDEHIGGGIDDADTGLEEEDEHIGRGADEGDGGDVIGGHDESSVSIGSRSSSGTCATSLMSPIVKMMEGVLESIRTTNALAQKVMLGELMAESIKEVMRLVVESGAMEGSIEHFMATILFVKAEYRVMFKTMATKEARFGWLKMWCQQCNMY